MTQTETESFNNLCKQSSIGLFEAVQQRLKLLETQTETAESETGRLILVVQIEQCPKLKLADLEQPGMQGSIRN